MPKRIGLIAAFIAGIIALSLVVRYANKPKTGELASRVDLDRPLIVGVVSWPGYAGGILANRGFKENAESIYMKKYGLPVRFVLIEDIDARGKAFAKGGPDGIDVAWSTVDFWANEAPNLSKGGIDAAAFLHVDWSRGGDAMVADDSIKTVEDLRGKTIALTQFTPSHWLLETALRASALSNPQQQAIRDSLVFTQDVATARGAFVAGRVDAAVLWEPDVKLALQRTNSHVLTSTKVFPYIVADVLLAKREFLKEHPRAIDAFVRGWLDGVKEAKQNPEATARTLMENEPLFGDLGFEATLDSLSWAHRTDVDDNVEMFGLDGKPARFDRLFSEASKIWQELKVIKNPLPPAAAKDDSFIRRVYEQQGYGSGGQ